MTNEEAISVFEEWIERDKKIEYADRLENIEIYNIAIKALKQQSKTAHWIRVTDKSKHFAWECNKCGWQQRFYSNYCPNCGANLEDKRYEQGYKDGYAKGFEEGIVLG